MKLNANRGMKMDKKVCTHDCEWNYHTREIVDVYGNEGSLDEWTCSECGEVMESERTT